jgi:hypothetical protein
MEIVRHDCKTFTVLGQAIHLYSEVLESGRSTVAEINGQFHYLGTEYPTVSSAIFTWQDINKRELTNEELRQVMIENNLISQGI